MNYKLFKTNQIKGLGEKIEKVFSEGILTEGKYSDDFEKKFSEFIGNDKCVLLNSATSALTLAYRLIGIKKGDEVIVSPMTCMATNEPLELLGAKLKFVDIDHKTGNVDINNLEKIINNKTKAISLIHWGGQPFDIKNVRKIAKKFNIKVIEDAAHALGAKYENKLIGNHGNYTVFSFQAIKHLTSVDGGVLVCPSKSEVDRAKKLRWFGLSRKFKGSKWKQDIKESGYKFHMNNVLATIGIENLKNLKSKINKHVFNGKFYDKNINNTKITLLDRHNTLNTFWIYSILVDSKYKFKKYMEKNRIDCDEVFIRNDKYTVFKKFRSQKLKGTDIFEKHMVNIPVGWWLNKKDISYIVDVVNKY